MALTLMYITNNPEVALIAEKYGVDRVWVDLETLGKEQRQPGNTVKSNHTISDIKKIKPLLSTADMLVRINPWNELSENEIEEVIQAGADYIMLPMWKTADEVKQFVESVSGRAKTVLLLETKEAEACLDDVLSLDAVNEIHIGLNDLHLSYGLDFMFELLANGTVERICKKISKTKIAYGFGGIARLGVGDLPAEKIVMEHYRLGSTRVILSRSFCDTSNVGSIDEIEDTFCASLNSLRSFEKVLEEYSPSDFEENRLAVIEDVQSIKNRIVKKHI